MLKLWMAVLATIVQAVIGFVSDGSVSGLEGILIGVAAVNAVIVGVVPNLSAGVAKYAKGVTSILMAVLTLASVLFADGWMSSQDWLQIGVAALAAVGVVGFPAPQWVITRPNVVAAPTVVP